jgi:hypothetical protein
MQERRKADALRENRDYSSLFSDGAEASPSTKEQTGNRPALVPKPGMSNTVFRRTFWHFWFTNTFALGSISFDEQTVLIGFRCPSSQACKFCWEEQGAQWANYQIAIKWTRVEGCSTFQSGSYAE